MRLDYLLFDATDEESGACSFDAMASVLPDRLPSLVREIEAVLGWAARAFGPPSDAADEGDWSFDLQATGQANGELAIGYDAGRTQVHVQHAPGGRITVSLTISGSEAFGTAFRQAFPDPD